MSSLNALVARTLKPALIIFGLVTCLPLLFAIDINLLPVLMRGVDFTPSSVPGLRHWGIMVFGMGALMIAAAFRPWLRFATLLFSTIEKAFMVYLWLSSLQAPWGAGYTSGAVMDSIITAYGILYFISSHGRPGRWNKA